MEPSEKSQTQAEVVERNREPSSGSRVPSDVRASLDHDEPDSICTSRNENAISLRAVDPVSVRLEHLSVSVNESPNTLGQWFSKKKASTSPDHVKKILSNVSADLPSGTLTAIIGGSGSGKTTLLNQMSGRIKGNRLSVSGRTLFNNSEDASSIRSAYVIQQDILIPTLTVRETLTYAAQLRLPSSVSQAERKQLVEEVILELR